MRTFSVRLSDTLHQLLEAEIRESGLSRSDLVRQAIAEHCDRLKARRLSVQLKRLHPTDSKREENV